MLKVLTYDDEFLKKKSENIEKIDKDIKKLAQDMYETMYFANGIGLAAVQVGVLKRLFVIDVPEFGKFEMINPRIIEKSKETSIYEEGCLSLPGIGNEVERSQSITIEYLDLDGNKKTLKATDLLATCIQHEYDHLEGILFIDRLPPEKRLKKIKEFTKLHIV